MSVKIQNLTNRPVLLRLNSGRTLHLTPRATSRELRDVEVEGTAKVKIEKLARKGVIALHYSAKKASPKTKRKKALSGAK